MTSVSFVKTTESYEVSLAIINGKLRMIPVSVVKITESYEFADWVTIWVVHSGTDRNRPYYVQHQTRLFGPCIAAISGVLSRVKYLLLGFPLTSLDGN